MGYYNKGARTERELLGKFYDNGYSVVRAAGSGVNALGPDLVVIRAKECIAIECKAWEKGSLALDPEQYMKLVEWERNTDFPTFVAWRMNGSGWFFIKLEEFTKAERNWNITRKKTVGINRRFEDVVGKKAVPAIHAVSPAVTPSL
ncbi:MAG: hypothetical protein KGH69_03135 [Candidatus Micrarchaeota archaeon]|nr:hypothetical protein [Candidatus Micrarchaeota archaeon]